MSLIPLSFTNAEHYHLENSCVLCRCNLPEPPTLNEDELERYWTDKCLIFWSSTRANGPPLASCASSDAFILPEISYEIVPMFSEASESVEICYNRFCGRRKVGAYAAHKDCWKVVKFCVGAKNLNTLIYKLGRSTRRFYPAMENHKDYHAFTTDLAPGKLNIRQNDEFGSLIWSLSELPIDIQFLILEHASNSPLRNALIASKVSSELIECISQKSPNYREVTLQLKPYLKSLAAKWINVYGGVYLADLTASGQEVEENTANALPLRPLRGLRFRLGPYGIQSLRLLYSDGTASSWLGKNNGEWVGERQGKYITGLKLQFDDLKVISVNLAEGEPESLSGPRDLVMWDRELTFSEKIVNYIWENIGLQPLSFPQIQGYSGWRFQSFKPLVQGSNYASGITVYCSYLTVHGIVIHNTTKSLIGNRKGCPIHLPLRYGEYLVSVWISRDQSQDSAPTLLMMTNLGRTQVFSTIGSQVDRHYSSRLWVPICENTSPIISLFTDELSLDYYHQILSIGFTKQTTTQSSHTLHRPLIPMPPNTHGGEYHVSLGSFMLVNKLCVRKDRVRCFGLWIEHTTGAVEILGQWDPSSPIRVTEIYNPSHGILTAISFRSLDGIIRDIVPECDGKMGDPSAVNEVYIMDLSSTIAWWFGDSMPDIVEFWRGTLEEIPERLPAGRVMDFAVGDSEGKILPTGFETITVQKGGLP